MEARPFEEYKEMIQDMSKEEMIKGLYDLSARIIKQENIIKEVRERLLNEGKPLPSPRELLELLDKEK